MLDGPGPGEGPTGAVPPDADPDGPVVSRGDAGQLEGAQIEQEQPLEPLEPAMQKIPKDAFLAVPEANQKELFLQLSGNDQDYLLNQFTVEELEGFFTNANFTPEEVQAIIQQQQMRKELKRRLDEASADDDKDLGERQGIMDPDMQREDKEREHDLEQLITEGRTPDGGLTNVSSIKPKLAGMTKTDAIEYLKGKDITKEQTLNELTADLTDAGETEEVSDQKREELRQTGEVWKKELEDADTVAEIEKQRHPENAKEIEAKQRKLRNLMLKVTDYFAEGEPGRKYARTGGKLVYFALLTAVVILLLEMNLIYKAASRAGGQRR